MTDQDFPYESSDAADSAPLTWAMLLAQCTEFARSAVALPPEGEAGLYRRSVAPVITLHAVTHALDQLERVDEAERRLALDRAEILIRQAASELDSIWDGDVPEALLPFLEDAGAALLAFMEAVEGVEWIVTADSAEWGHPGELALALASAGLEMDLYLPAPGVPLFRGSVAGYADLSAAAEAAPEVVAVVSAFLGASVGEAEAVESRRQVYRQFDFARGGPVRDVVAPASAEGVAGQPLLVPVLLGGEIQPVAMPPRKREPLPPLPVEILDPSEA